MAKTPTNFLESSLYEEAKQRLNRDINRLPQRYSTTAYLDGNPIPCALDRHAAPNQLIIVDYSVFKKTKEEKELLLNLKLGVPKSRSHKFTTFFHGSY
jgi:hypothetical protein